MFAVYVLGSLALGERFPFSNFSMFSSEVRTETIFVVRADGLAADPVHLTGYRGGPAGKPAATPGDWILAAFTEQTHARRAADGAPDGPLTITADVCTASLELPARRTRVDCEPFWRGTARRRWR